MSYKLLIKGGRVIDPAQGLNDVLDIAVNQGEIAAVSANIPDSAAHKIIDAQGLVVTPGLINMHGHVAEAIVSFCLPPDDVGVYAGVTAVCDAGSTGYANFDAFRQLIIFGAQTDVFAFLHLSPIGEAIIPEIDYRDIDLDLMLDAINANRDIIRGIKIRAVGNVMAQADFDVVTMARKVADASGLPIMVHLGLDRGDVVDDEVVHHFTRHLLAHLREGDILTHIYTDKPGGVLQTNGVVFPGLQAILDRGVLLDVGSANGHLSFEVARAAIQQGILPTTLSTDVTALLDNDPQYASLTVLMSKFLALGLSLEQVVAMTTINPARALGEETRRGSLKVGMPADITLLELEEGAFSFLDGRPGNTIQGNQLLSPRFCLKNGVEIATEMFSKEDIWKKPSRYQSPSSHTLKEAKK
jgi:dihydroorotase